MLRYLRSSPVLCRLLKYTGGILLLWAALAYILLPQLWRHYEHHPSLASAPKTTFTGEGIPGDPLNVGFVGQEEDVIQSMDASGWLPADPITFRTSARITTSALFGKPYPTAPVSNLYVWGRVEDLAFEQPVPGNTRQRHHVRFWKSADLGKDGRPLWIGAVTFDRSVGVSHLTGKITHHIDADVDEERDRLMNDIRSHGQLVSLYQVTGIGSSFFGRNGGGDKYYTDGELSVGVLGHAGAVNPSAITQKDNPVAVTAKNTVWMWLKQLLKKLRGDALSLIRYPAAEQVGLWWRSGSGLG